MSLALAGYMGSGKSAVARAMAEAKGLGLIDVDQKIEERHGPISEIFASQGEAGFRQYETQAIKELAQTPNAVIALGGGALTVGHNLALLQRSGVPVVYLRVPLWLCWARVQADPNRPLATSRAEFEQRYRKRVRQYKSAAFVTIDAYPGGPQDVGQRVFAALRQEW